MGVQAELGTAAVPVLRAVREQLEGVSFLPLPSGSWVCTQIKLGSKSLYPLSPQISFTDLLS